MRRQGPRRAGGAGGDHRKTPLREFPGGDGGIPDKIWEQAENYLVVIAENRQSDEVLMLLGLMIVSLVTVPLSVDERGRQEANCRLLMDLLKKMSQEGIHFREQIAMLAYGLCAAALLAAKLPTEDI